MTNKDRLLETQEKFSPDGNRVIQTVTIHFGNSPKKSGQAPEKSEVQTVFRGKQDRSRDHADDSKVPTIQSEHVVNQRTISGRHGV